MAGYLRTLTLVAAIGAGLVAGVLFAFSTFVIKALRHLPPAQAISAMQAINKAAPTPLFMLALLGTAVISVALAILAAARLTGPPARYVIAGSVLYLAGVALTITYHVPRNNALAILDPSAPGSAATWHHYVTAWTAWNHLRTLTSLAAAITFTLALGICRPQQSAALDRHSSPTATSWLTGSPPGISGSPSRDRISSPSSPNTTALLSVSPSPGRGQSLSPNGSGAWVSSLRGVGTAVPRRSSMPSPNSVADAVTAAVMFGDMAASHPAEGR